MSWSLRRTDKQTDWPLVGLGALVLGLAVPVGLAFRVSWGALRDVGVAIGLDPTAANVYPLQVDSLIALALITSLVLARSPKDRRVALVVLGVYTGVSLVLNYVHGLNPDLHGLANQDTPARVALAPWTAGTPALINPLLILLAAGLPVASIFCGSDLVSRVFRYTLSLREEHKRHAEAAPEATALETAVRDQLAAALPTVAEDVSSRLATDLDAVRDRVQVLTDAGQADATVRDQLRDGLDAVRDQIQALGTQVTQVADRSAVETAVRDQLADALPDVRRDLRQAVTTDLTELRDQVTQQAVTAAAAQAVADVDGRVRDAVAEELGAVRDYLASVQQINSRRPRELPGRTQPARPARADDEQATAQEIARGIFAREGRPPSRRRLAREAGVTEHIARVVLGDLDAAQAVARHGEQLGEDAQPPTPEQVAANGYASPSEGGAS